MGHMTEIEARRAAYDRRAKAWTLLVFGVLAVWLVGFGGLGQDAPVWKVLGYVGVCGGAALIVWALTLFRAPRP